MSRGGANAKRRPDPLVEMAYADPMRETFRVERGGKLWRSRLFEVNATPLNFEEGFAGFVHLSIKRLDRSPIHDWRILQRLKNDTVGPDREAIEIYPAEDRLVDEANQFHLWVLPEGLRVPVGFLDRQVGGTERAAAIGARQRPWGDDAPPDLDAVPNAVTIRLAVDCRAGWEQLWAAPVDDERESA